MDKPESPPTVTGYFFGYSGKFLTKAEYDAAVEAARLEEERLAALPPEDWDRW
ncbi:MAG: hypothetical protein WAN65_19135 [Candidatus Sulfotelmatobacter sp.]